MLQQTCILSILSILRICAFLHLQISRKCTKNPDTENICRKQIVEFRPFFFLNRKIFVSTYHAIEVEFCALQIALNSGCFQ